MQNCAIRAEIALLLTNQIAGNAIDFKMNIIKQTIMRYKPTGIRSSDQIHRINTQARRYRGWGGAVTTTTKILFRVSLAAQLLF